MELSLITTPMLFMVAAVDSGYKVIHARHAGTYLFLLTAYMNSAWDARLIINRNNSHQIGFVEGRTGSNDHTSSSNSYRYPWRW